MSKAQRSTPRGTAPAGDIRRGGFTLIEIITVILIVGILAAVITTRGSLTGGELAARTSEIRAQLRYLQLLAMKNGVNNLMLRCDGTSYWAYDTNNATNVLPLPGESTKTVALSSKNMTMSAFAISFNAFGIPHSGTTPAKLTANATITIGAGGQSGQLTVMPETGFTP